MSLSEINLRRTTDRKALMEIIRGIAAGTIRARSFAAEDALGNAKFSDAEIQQHLVRHGAAVLMTAGEVARHTGWKPECVTHWCSEGLLEATKGDVGGAAAWLIEVPELASFQTRYLVLSDLAAQSGTTSRALLRRLASRGIETVGAKSVGSTSRGHLLPAHRVGELISALGKESIPAD